jgi:hypothetical protein
MEKSRSWTPTIPTLWQTWVVSSSLSYHQSNWKKKSPAPTLYNAKRDFKSYHVSSYKYGLNRSNFQPNFLTTSSSSSTLRTSDSQLSNFTSTQDFYKIMGSRPFTSLSDFSSNFFFSLILHSSFSTLTHPSP